MRTLAIGDIHGCNTALGCLLTAVLPATDDRVVFVGDYIDRGPGSREVVEMLLNLSKTTSPIFLRGNHEAMILEAREDPLKANLWQSYGGLETLYSYAANSGLAGFHTGSSLGLLCSHSQVLRNR
jgi:serine/threonine protein phosphatase 1